VLADLPPSRGGAAQVLRHRAWTPDNADNADERSGEREARPTRRSSSSFITQPLRESFFDLAQRYHRLREAAFNKAKPSRAERRATTERSVRTDTTPPPIPLVTRERRLTDLPPPPKEESFNESVFADRDVEEAPEEATLVQPLARRPSEAPPPQSERRVFTTVRPPPPPDPLPRIAPSTLPPPVALATIPPPPPPAPPPTSVWRPMLATAALSATIGAIVSVGMWAVRSPDGASRQTVASVSGPVKAEPTATSTIGPCPIPGATSNSNSSTSSSTSQSLQSSSLSHSQSSSQVPREVSLDALPVESRSPRALANTTPVLRAPAPAAPAPRAVVVPPPRPARAERPARAAVETPRVESERASHHSRKAAEAAAAADSDDESATPAPPPPDLPPAPTAGPDKAAIAKAVGRAAAAASGCDVSPQSGRAQITFAPSGNVQSVTLIEPFSDNSVNGCVLRALGRAHVPPFAGEPVIVRKALSW
jgi:hypothetical protein